MTFTATSPLTDLFPNASQTEIVAAGDTLFRQGDPALAIYFVERGSLRLERVTLAGTLVVLHTACEGELLAEGALAASHYHCNAVAQSPSQVRVYAKAQILAHLPPGSVGYGLVTIHRELQDIAAELGLSREALYRTLAALQKEGRIRRHATHISLQST